MKIEYIHEPNDLACGQAVLAMLSGKNVFEVIKDVGTERETNFSQMKQKISDYGFVLGSERMTAKDVKDLPNLALLSLETPRCWHWSLYSNGKFYDPEHGVLEDFPVSNRKYFWKITKK